MYSYDEIFKTISEMLVSDFEIKPEQIKPEVKLFEDLDLDSIDAVDLIVRLQKIIKRKVNAEDFKQIRTLDDVVKVVERLVNAPQ